MGGNIPEESIVGLVNNSLVDMAAAFLPKEDSYRELVSFSLDLDEGVWRMMLKRPKESAAGSGLLAPFNSVVWYLILVAVLFYGPGITLFTNIQNRLIPGEEKLIPFSSSFWFVYGAFIKQGTTLEPEGNTTRVLFTTWWIFIILLSAFYTANLTAFLTLSKFTLEIRSPEDLFKKNYRWVSRGGAAVQYAITNPKEDLYYLNQMVVSGRAKFYTMKKNTDYLPLVDNGAVLIKEQVGIDELMQADYLGKVKNGVPESDRCTYVVTPNVFMRKVRGFAYPKESKLGVFFDKTLTHIIHAGLIEYFKRQNMPRSKICPLDLQSKDRQLRNSDLMMTYLIMVTGLAAALAVFIGERLIHRYGPINHRGNLVKSKRKKIKFNKHTRVHNYHDSRPPSYDSIFGRSAKIKVTNTVKRRIINGREYLMINTPSGEVRLIPVRTPSAFLYQLDVNETK